MILLPDTLSIPYAELGPQPSKRLSLLEAIGMLINHEPGHITVSNIRVSQSNWEALQTWISMGNALPFWTTESNQILVLRSCTRHLLIGTSLLISDIQYCNQHTRSEIPSLDTVWQSARLYTQQEITNE